jgi:hypothetical protein
LHFNSFWDKLVMLLKQLSPGYFTTWFLWGVLISSVDSSGYIRLVCVHQVFQFRVELLLFLKCDRSVEPWVSWFIWLFLAFIVDDFSHEVLEILLCLKFTLVMIHLLVIRWWHHRRSFNFLSQTLRHYIIVDLNPLLLQFQDQLPRVNVWAMLVINNCSLLLQIVILVRFVVVNLRQTLVFIAIN